ncbi:MAG: hypothetical protein DCF31_12950, partial [Alphaproteobacteria bacterium]
MATRAASTMTRSRAPAAPQGRVARLAAAVRAAVRRFVILAAALVLVVLAVALVAAILTWSPLDPSFNAITGRRPTNALGSA